MSDFQGHKSRPSRLVQILFSPFIHAKLLSNLLMPDVQYQLYNSRPYRTESSAVDQCSSNDLQQTIAD
jgi:hypothetical protein